MIDSSESFKFDIEYEFNEDKDFYLAIALHDIKRGGIPYDSGGKNFKMEKGHRTASFQMPLNLFNSGKFRILVSLRVPNEIDPERTDMVAFTSDDNSCMFVVNNEGSRDYALLNDQAMHIERLA